VSDSVRSQLRKRSIGKHEGWEGESSSLKWVAPCVCTHRLLCGRFIKTGLKPGWKQLGEPNGVHPSILASQRSCRESGSFLPRLFLLLIVLVLVLVLLQAAKILQGAGSDEALTCPVCLCLLISTGSTTKKNSFSGVVLFSLLLKASNGSCTTTFIMPCESGKSHGRAECSAFRIQSLGGERE